MAVIQLTDGGCLDDSSGDENAEKCSESVANLEVRLMEFGHCIDVRQEEHWGQTGREDVENNSEFLYWVLGSW